VTIIVVSPTSPLTFFWDIVLSMGYEIQIEREINLEKRTKERERKKERDKDFVERTIDEEKEYQRKIL
jgi:hypothetical protein